MDRTELFKIIEWLVDNNHVKLLTPGSNILDKIESLNNSMSEGERQPVGNNEGNGSVFICQDYYEGKKSARCTKLCGKGLCF